MTSCREALEEFVAWSEEHPDIWEEHGEIEPATGHPRHIQCIAPADIAWLDSFAERAREALAPEPEQCGKYHHDGLLGPCVAPKGHDE